MSPCTKLTRPARHLSKGHRLTFVTHRGYVACLCSDDVRLFEYGAYRRQAMRTFDDKVGSKLIYFQVSTD